jgi:hypothetical protein
MEHGNMAEDHLLERKRNGSQTMIGHYQNKMKKRNELLLLLLSSLFHFHPA